MWSRDLFNASGDALLDPVDGDALLDRVENDGDALLDPVMDNGDTLLDPVGDDGDVLLKPVGDDGVMLAELSPIKFEESVRNAKKRRHRRDPRPARTVPSDLKDVIVAPNIMTRIGRWRMFAANVVFTMFTVRDEFEERELLLQLQPNILSSRLESPRPVADTFAHYRPTAYDDVIAQL